jgi:hypothetical protein
MRSVLGNVILALILVSVSGGIAYAHGGIAGPDELGPPVITSAVIGVACYWLVMLWPSRGRREMERRQKMARRGTR